ncbi:substrate-binding domain-containing protein [Microbacterium gorillae]|uniref:substrate-binding domain-containing protein n=1 Tax=Microbacterium gorillae TaxID=1231063 RepID=UPI00058FF5E2|nr:substrate-binding domain-containing protein [Microbacterium gorillae]
MKKISKLSIAAGAVLLILSLGACSSDDADGAAATGSANATTGSEGSAAQQEALATAFKGMGSDLSGLESVKVKPDQTFYVISCGEAVPSCHLPAAAMVAAAEAAGWKAKIADGNLNSGGTGFADAVNQAVAAGATVISPIGFPCVAAQTAFTAAKAAGVTIVGGGGVDNCNPQEWASIRLWIDGQDPETGIWHAQAALQADYAYGKVGDDIKAVVVNATGGPWGQFLVDGFKTRLTDLGVDADKAVVDVVDVSDEENGDGSYVQKVQTELLAHPEANVLIIPVDGYLTGGLSQAIVTAGLDKQLLIIGRSGDESALQLIKAGNSGFDATIGYASEWGAWGSVDTAIRILAGQKPAYIGEEIQAIDADNNMPASGDYVGSVDFKKAFKAAWGVD